MDKLLQISIKNDSKLTDQILKSYSALKLVNLLIYRFFDIDEIKEKKNKEHKMYY